MDLAEFKRFLSLCDFNNYYPIVEGKRFWSDEELDEWFNQDVTPPYNVRIGGK